MFMRALATAATTAALLMAASTAAAAPPSSEPMTIHAGLVSPLHLAVGPGKAVTVSESFAGKLTTFERGSIEATYQSDGFEVAGAEYRGSTLFFVESVGAGEGDPEALVGVLKAIDARGNVTVITDELAAYERENNPDSEVRYGLSEAEAAANPECVAQLTEGSVPTYYMGSDVIDSHVYGLEVVGNTAYVADAGANAVLEVNLKTGAISTAAVLPAQYVTINADAAEMLGVPACEGLSYGFEAVPTDIEVGPDGMLYVALLPGGPEDASLGLRGSVVRVDPTTGEVETYVDSLMTPTGIAFDGRGNLYVASLFGEGVYKVAAGTLATTLFLPAQMAAEVDVQGNTLYVTTEAMGDGALLMKRL